MLSTTNFLVRKLDTNLWGGLFGGRLMSEMDVCGYYSARRVLAGTEYDYVVLAGIREIKFLKPAFVGDIVHLESEVTKLGNTSIILSVNAIREDINGQKEQIMSSEMTYVGMKNGKPMSLPIQIANSDVESITYQKNGFTIKLKNGKSIFLDNEVIDRLSKSQDIGTEFRSKKFSGT